MRSKDVIKGVQHLFQSKPFDIRSAPPENSARIAPGQPPRRLRRQHSLAYASLAGQGHQLLPALQCIHGLREEALASAGRIGPDVVAHELPLRQAEEPLRLEAGLAGGFSRQDLSLFSWAFKHRDLLDLASVLQFFQSRQSILEGIAYGHARPQSRVKWAGQGHGRSKWDRFIHPQNGGNSIFQEPFCRLASPPLADSQALRKTRFGALSGRLVTIFASSSAPKASSSPSSRSKAK
ncbi:MAG: hypothetical protein BWY77_01673 [bacterium ADurb.Bin431]|nr:MAG: hypothetical protein BWY77_01673 [bacterium ADurb.Bin431]